VNIDVKPIKEFQKKLTSAEKSVDKCCRSIAKELGSAYLQSVIPKTPVYAPKTVGDHYFEAYDHGSKRKSDAALRKKWSEDNRNIRVVKTGGDYEVTIRNSSPYASFVDEGHTQRVGEKFPTYMDGQLIMATHRVAFVNGENFTGKAIAEVERKARSIEERNVKVWLKI